MENVQRSVMLLKPDTHIAGQWQGGATLRLNAVPDGVFLSLQGNVDLGEQCNLILFTGDGIPILAGELNGAVLQTKVLGAQIKNIAGAAVVCGDRFLLKSSGLNWPDVVARYRFALARPTPSPPEPIETEYTPEAVIKTSEPVETAETTLPQKPSIKSESEVSEESQEAAPASFQESETPQPSREPEQPCPGGIRQSPVDPFPGVFPGSEWVKISLPWSYGMVALYIWSDPRVNGYDADVVGVPGDYSMAPPAWLDGFSTYVRCSSGDARGYWLMFQDAQTGQVLDISRFRHGG